VSATSRAEGLAVVFLILIIVDASGLFTSGLTLTAGLVSPLAGPRGSRLLPRFS
jgi:hypothetical protein